MQSPQAQPTRSPWFAQLLAERQAKGAAAAEQVRQQLEAQKIMAAQLAQQAIWDSAGASNEGGGDGGGDGGGGDGGGGDE